jgi:hypothetical protein
MWGKEFKQHVPLCLQQLYTIESEGREERGETRPVTDGPALQVCCGGWGNAGEALRELGWIWMAVTQNIHIRIYQSIPKISAHYCRLIISL